MTGESAPVIRESGGDRSAVTGGTLVVSDWIVVRITAAPGSTFLDRMIALVEGASRQKTPNEIALDILLAGMTIIFLIAVATLVGLASWNGAAAVGAGAGGAAGHADPDDDRRPALGHRHRRHGPPGALQRAGDLRPRGGGRRRRGRAAARQDRHHHAGQPPGGRVHPGARRDRARRGGGGGAGLSLADETPEGRSILAFARERYGIAAPALPAGRARGALHGADPDLRPRPAGRRLPQGRGGRAAAQPRRRRRRRRCARRWTASPAPAARRWRWRGMAGCSARSS